MRINAQERSNRKIQPPVIVGTVLCIKVDMINRRKLDPHSVPEVICKVTENEN
jgi:hypothetical protein